MEVFMKRIGIIGQGFVGKAIRKVINSDFEVITYDKKSNNDVDFHYKGGEYHCWSSSRNYLNPYQCVVDNVDLIFICLPTPMRSDGSCDTSIVEEVVKTMDDYKKSITLVLKSTVPPGTTERLNQKYKYISIVFNPEFLTERSAVEDFKNQHHIILGGSRHATSFVKQMYQKSHPSVPVLITDSTTAEMIKYVTNCFFATKVSFANEMKQICDKMNIDYNKVVEYLGWDDRLGITHWAVPGHDGLCGWGGACFAKDLNSLISQAKSLGIDPKMMLAAWEKNLEVRSERDWEKLKGRAVSE
jgi:UDPglucose 6-dehydrogenase